MARPPIPSYLLENRGAYKKNPNRKRNDPVDDRALGDPPEHLNKSERAAWLELAGNALPDTLGRADRTTLELTVSLLLKLRSGAAMASELSLLATQLAKLGMSPADRSRVVAIPKPKTNDFVDL
jgi:hypothetical protein